MYTAGFLDINSTIFCFSGLVCESHIPRWKYAGIAFESRPKKAPFRPSIPSSQAPRRDRCFENDTGLFQPSSFYEGAAGIIFRIIDTLLRS